MIQYYYKFDPQNKLTHTAKTTTCPNGYVSFLGNELADADGCVDWTKKHMVDGKLEDIPAPVISEPIPYVPTTEEIKANLINAVQGHLDSVARLKGYDGIISAASYAPFSNVPAFQNEGLAYGTWRSDVWALCYAYMAEVEAGTKAIPTASELIALLPAPPAPIEYVMYGNNA